MKVLKAPPSRVRRSRNPRRASSSALSGVPSRRRDAEPCSVFHLLRSPRSPWHFFVLPSFPPLRSTASKWATFLRRWTYSSVVIVGGGCEASRWAKRGAGEVLERCWRGAGEVLEISLVSKRSPLSHADALRNREPKNSSRFLRNNCCGTIRSSDHAFTLLDKRKTRQIFASGRESPSVSRLVTKSVDPKL